MLHQFKFKLGLTVEDKFTGFVGKINSAMIDTSNSETYGVVPSAEGNGEFPKTAWIDVGRLVQHEPEAIRADKCGEEVLGQIEKLSD